MSGQYEFGRSPLGGSVYELYLRSYYNDGKGPVGTLEGARNRLDYLAELGVGTVWFTPFYPSGGVDGGYDVTDYRAVDREYGTLNGFREFVAGARARRIGVMVDLVLNHTSDQHPWFEQSRSSVDNPMRDWYIWRPPGPGGGPPNGWKSRFSYGKEEGVPAWTLDGQTAMYYLHNYSPHQPDLNIFNPAVQKALMGIVKFWLQLGVDFYRTDAAHSMLKDPRLADPNSDIRSMGAKRHGSGYLDSPAIAIFYGWKAALKAHRENNPGSEPHMLLEAAAGEHALSEADLRQIDAIAPGLISTLNFLQLDTPWSAGPWQKQLQKYLSELPKGAVPNFLRGCHDRPRMADTDTIESEEAARAYAVATMTQPGVDVAMQGEELGLRNGIIEEKDRRDEHEGRDGARTPMPWDGSVNGGWGPGKLWLPPHQDYLTHNAAAQAADPESTLALHRKLYAMKQKPVMREGSVRFLPHDNDNHVMVYERALDADQLAVVVNTVGEARFVRAPDASWAAGNIALASARGPARRGDEVNFDEGFMIGGDQAVVISRSR